MTRRSKQWYTKTSRLENSFAKSSIGRSPGILPWKQDHRSDDRWSQKAAWPKAGRNGGAGSVREERVPRERNRRFGSLGLQKLHQDWIFVELKISNIFG